MGRTQIQAVAFAFVLVTSMALAPLAGVGAVGTAAAQDETQVRTCDDPVSIAVGAIVGFGKGGFDGATSEENPCIKTENIADADTTEEAKRIIAQEAMEDKRYWETYETQFDTYSNEMKNPAYSDARITFVEAVANGSDRVEAVTEARRAAHARTASQQRELWVYYSSLADSIGTLESKAEDKGIRGESMKIGHVNSSGAYETGYTFHTDATVNVTVTNGSKVTLPAAVKEGNTSKKLNPLDDDLLVRVHDPEAGEWISLMNTGMFSYPATGQTDVAVGESIEMSFSFDGTVTDSLTLDVGGVGFVVGSYTYSGEGDDGVEISSSTDVSSWDGGGDYVDNVGAGTHSIEIARTGNTTADLIANGQTLKSGVTVDWSAKTNLDPGGVTVESQNFAVMKQQESYTNTFREKHNEIESVDNDVISGLGDSSSGYLSDVFDAYENGEINITESLWSYDRVRMAPDEMESTATQNLARERLGLGRSDSGASASVTIHKGAVVNGQTLEENTTYDTATLWATSPPPNASWSADTTYSVSDVGGLAGLNYEATNSYQEDGSVKYEVVTRMANIESGEFTVNSLTTSDGESVTVIEHDDNDPESTNVTDLNQQISDLSEAIELYRDQLEDDDATIGPGAGGGGGINIDLPGLGSIGLPFNSLAVNLGAIGMVAVAGVVVLFVAGPTGRIISLAWKVSRGSGKAAEKAAGLTDARGRGIERYRDR